MIAAGAGAAVGGPADVPIAFPIDFPADFPADFAAALLDPDQPCPPGLKTWNGADPARRLAVHRNNVVSGLVDVLADAFEVTQALVGAEFFRAMAAVFVRRHPPRSRILAGYGAGLPAFIEAFGPAAGLPCLADVARLEAERVRACHAAEAAPLAGEALEAVMTEALAGGERIGELQLVLHPSVGVVVSRWAAVSIWAAHQVEDAAAVDLGAVDPAQPEDALVWRVDEEVRVLRLAPGAAAFILAVQAGQALGEAAAGALRSVGAASSIAFDLAGTLALLRGQGALIAIHLPWRNTP